MAHALGGHLANVVEQAVQRGASTCNVCDKVWEASYGVIWRCSHHLRFGTMVERTATRLPDHKPGHCMYDGTCTRCMTFDVPLNAKIYVLWDGQILEREGLRSTSKSRAHRRIQSASKDEASITAVIEGSRASRRIQSTSKVQSTSKDPEYVEEQVEEHIGATGSHLCDSMAADTKSAFRRTPHRQCRVSRIIGTLFAVPLFLIRCSVGPAWAQTQHTASK